jgi:hypothetical protein
MDEGRKRVVLIAPAILVARHLKNAEDLHDYRPSPRPKRLFANAVRSGERMKKIDPDTQPVSLVLGNFSTTIPARSFKTNKKGVYTFEGKINGVNLQFKIAPAGTASFTFSAEAAGANLAGTSNPVTLELLIGGNGGTTQVNAEIH